MPHAWATAFDQVVRPKTPRGDGNSRRGMARQAWLGGRQTQNPERGRKLHHASCHQSASSSSSDPKPREGTETHIGDGDAARGHAESSDPKPREGTETWDICCPPGEMLSEVVRPKTPRGDGNFVDHHCHSLSPRVVRPKTPRGDGNIRTSSRQRRKSPVVRPKTPRGDGNPATIAPARADDSGRQTQNPERGRKPHGPGRAADGPGGRQTQNPERGRKLDCANWLGADPGGRQTQNPERGRKLHIDFLDLARREDHVVRPKTPREDGNSSTIASMSMSQSSSRQTQNPERGRKLDCANWLGADPGGRQTQNPERGRKPHGPGRAADGPGGRQTQNPERGRKHSESHVLTADSHVVRPKTPRGDGNRAAFDTRSS
ncbi:Uncharacterised protein [Mycobacterium tuberculosis]|nr:Uncharacterised protein [Mycobacterium tuberculosis]